MSTAWEDGGFQWRDVWLDSGRHVCGSSGRWFKEAWRVDGTLSIMGVGGLSALGVPRRENRVRRVKQGWPRWGREEFWLGEK